MISPAKLEDAARFAAPAIAGLDAALSKTWQMPYSEATSPQVPLGGV